MKHNYNHIHCTYTKCGGDLW